MDYTKQPLTFQARKALRYARLYGPSRTLVKIRSQYHMRRHYVTLPQMRRAAQDDPGRHVGIIGCGKFAYSVIAYYLRHRQGGVVRAAMDIDMHRAASLASRYDLSYYTDDAERILDDPRVDLIYIASNHASHADYAVAALARGKHVHVEKPHVVSFEQLHELCAAIPASSGRIGLGFNRPNSPFGRKISQAIGEQEGPMMLNWFVAGHDIPPGHWYYRPEEGGRVLGNLCHWTDHVLQLVPREQRYPIGVHPVRAGQSDCDIGVSYVFGDGSIATITFSAKGHAFEGVKERFAAHRGDLLVAMDDFEVLTVERREHKRTMRLRRRDHGHEATILRSYAMSRGGPGLPVEYVWETGELFLRTREALEADGRLSVDGFRAESAVTLG